MNLSRNMPERLDALEAVAVRAITNTYGPDFTDTERFWLQKGIEGMRYAVAEEALAEPNPTERTC